MNIPLGIANALAKSLVLIKSVQEIERYSIIQLGFNVFESNYIV